MKKIIFLTLGIIIIIGLAVMYSFPHRQVRYYDTQSDASDSIGDITADTDIRLEFTAMKDNLESISLKFGTYGRANTGNLNIELLDASGTVVFQESVNVAEVKDNVFTIFTFDPYVSSSQLTFTLLISSPDCAEKNAVTIYKCQPKGTTTQFFLNGEKQEQALVFAATYHNFDVETLVVILFFITTILAFVIFIYKFL
jgi:hypothetical protein